MFLFVVMSNNKFDCVFLKEENAIDYCKDGNSGNDPQSYSQINYNYFRVSAADPIPDPKED